MLVFLRCVAEAVAAKGIRGLIELVPGGQYLHDVAADALLRHRDKKAAKKPEDDVKELLEATADAVVEAARQAVEEAAPDLSPREKELVTQFVAAIPEATRQSMKRKEDPSGRSLPFGFTIHTAEDVAKLLPQTPPRFAPGDPVPGLSSWRLERRLGAGGFGEVWLAGHEWKPERRAVKFCIDPTSRARLVSHEKEMILRVMRHTGEHPNIVPLLECNLAGDAPWLMYEYVPGGTLADLILDWAKLPAPERLNRVVTALHTLAGAVGHFHKLAPPIIHRDLKPANVLAADGEVFKITDFGIGGTAADYQIAEQTRAARSLVGQLPSMLSGSYSMLYASPQQRAGEKPDPRDDVHALGVIAYQMLTGDLTAAPGRDMDDDLKDAGAADDLIELIGKSVAQKADRRPKDATEFAARLPGLSKPAAPTDAERRTQAEEDFQRGQAYYHGRGVAQDEEKAKEWYEKAASQLHAIAQFKLGGLYARNFRVAQDRAKAIEWLEKAAGQGDVSAMWMLGYLGHVGHLRPMDDAKMREWFEKAAAHGHAKAQCHLGRFYYDGRGGPQDYAKAREWVEKAAEQGEPDAQYALGLLCEDGLGGPKDYAKAKECYRKAAANREWKSSVWGLFAPAALMAVERLRKVAPTEAEARAEEDFQRGKAYYLGRGVPEDNARAKEWFEKAAAQGHPEAQYHLGKMYRWGQGAPEDPVTAKEWYDKAAAQGYGKAMYELGALYEFGKSTPEAYAKAKEWYEKAVAHGDMDAYLYGLGQMYLKGRGVPKDAAKAKECFEKAREWYEKAAAQGDTEAQFALGLMHQRNPCGVPEDEVTARMWFQKAAAQGHAAAQNRLGVQYQSGAGGPRDYAKARELYEKLAAQGDLFGQAHLADFCYEGKGGPRDYAKARELYEKLVARGDEDAMLKLGEIYEKGRGVPKNVAKALEWYRKAAEGALHRKRAEEAIHRLENRGFFRRLFGG